MYCISQCLYSYIRLSRRLSPSCCEYCCFIISHRFSLPVPRGRLALFNFTQSSACPGGRAFVAPGRPRRCSVPSSKPVVTLSALLYPLHWSQNCCICHCPPAILHFDSLRKKWPKVSWIQVPANIAQRERSRSPRRRSRSPRRRRSYSPRSRSRSRDDYRRSDRRSRSPMTSGAGGYSGSSYGRGGGAAPPPRSFEERAQAKEQMMASVRESSQQERRVYVGNLSYDVKWHHLKDFMRQGKIIYSPGSWLPIP